MKNKRFFLTVQSWSTVLQMTNRFGLLSPGHDLGLKLVKTVATYKIFFRKYDQLWISSKYTNQNCLYLVSKLLRELQGLFHKLYFHNTKNMVGNKHSPICCDGTFFSNRYYRVLHVWMSNMYILLLSWWAPLANCSAVQDLTLQSDGACAQSFRSAALARPIALYVLLLLLLFWCWPFQPDSIHKLAFYLVWAAIYMAMIFSHIKIFWKLTWFLETFSISVSKGETDEKQLFKNEWLILPSILNSYEDRVSMLFCNSKYRLVACLVTWQ